MGNVIKKLAIGLVVGGVLVGITRALEFPFIFQMMFFGYAMLGAAVFMLLDAPIAQDYERDEVLDRPRGVLRRAVHGVHFRRLDVAAIRSGR